VGRAAGPSADTDRWRAGAPLPGAAVHRRRSSSVVGIVALLLVALLVAVGAYLVRSTDLLTAFGGPPATAATATPVQGTGTPSVVTPTAPGLFPGSGTPPTGVPSPGATAAGTPGSAASPVAVATVTPSPVAEMLPSATPAPTLPPTAPSTEAIPTPDPRRGPLAAQFVSPTDGARVPARPPIIGRRTGMQGPDEHLWMLIHPEGGPDNWWPYKGELIAERDGTWRIDDVEIGGPSGSRHVLAIGVVDADGQRQMQAQIREHRDEPFVNGQPPFFHELSRVTVVKQ
jgi:hypothetical protein